MPAPTSRRRGVVLAASLAALVAIGTPVAMERVAEASVRIRLRTNTSGEVEDVTREVVRMWRSQLGACYADLPEEDLRYQHKMTVRGKVDADGALAEREIEGKVSDEYVQECIDFTFDSMRFEGIENQSVQFQLRFNSH